MEQAFLQKAQQYAERNQLRLGSPLGSGNHGSVFVAQGNVKANRSAVKAHKEDEAYWRERLVYQRLSERAVHEIEGFNVPQLLNADDQLLVLEMTIVDEPFLLDFGGAYLHNPPTFPDDVWLQWHEQKQDQFGARLPIVENVLSTLKGYGIHLLDIHPRNIRFLGEH